MKYLNYILISFTLLVSCNNEGNNDDCIEYETAYVTSVNSPVSGSVNETINIDLNFNVKNGCGNFHNFIETDDGNTKTIEIIAKYEGCPCIQAIIPKTVIYEFEAQNAGTYTLKFKSNETDFIEAILTIE